MTDAPLQWRSDACTDPGSVRSVNEDALLERGDAGLWVVADGMGGHSRGDVASAMVVDALRESPPAEHLADLVDSVEDTLLDVDARIRALTEREGAVMGSTVAALVAHGDWGVCLWAGDSRVYRLRGHELTQITEDHAYVQDLVRAGLVSEAEAAHHPQANIVTRAVGAGPRLQLDAEVVDLRPGDRFLLCSDGLVRDIDPEELLPALGGALEGAAGALVRQALDVGAQDNVTALVVALENGAAA